MTTIIILIGAGIIYGYLNHYSSSKLFRIGLAGLLAGLVVFGAQVVLADQPKVPCWTEMHGGAQFFRAMPFMCQNVAETLR